MVRALNKITDYTGVDDIEAFEHDRNCSIHERDEQVRSLNDDSISQLLAQQIKTINGIAGDMLDAFGSPRL